MTNNFVVTLNLTCVNVSCMAFFCMAMEKRLFAIWQIVVSHLANAMTIVTCLK